MTIPAFMHLVVSPYDYIIALNPGKEKASHMAQRFCASVTSSARTKTIEVDPIRVCNMQTSMGTVKFTWRKMVKCIWI